MYVRYDNLNRHEPLTLTLCNLGSTYSDINYAPNKVIGILIDTSDEELVLNFNQISELNVRVARIYREDADDDAHAYNLYKSIQPRRLIYVTGIGYFMIADISEGFNEDGLHYKDIKARSIETEIQNRKVPFIPDNTYRFSCDSGKGAIGLFESLVKTLPMWTIGYVDEAVASKYRTFEDVDTDLNVLAFMLENMQDAYECIFIFDITKRVINVYDQNNYVRQTDIHITKEDIIRSIDITENSDNLYTAISVLGDNDITISAINPLGGNVIYNFDHYLNWMSVELRESVVDWQKAVNTKKQDYYDINLKYYKRLEEANKLQLECERIDTQLTMYKRCKENVIAESGNNSISSLNAVIEVYGGKKITVHGEISKTIHEINTCIVQCINQLSSVRSALNREKHSISINKAEIEDIQKSLSFAQYFTKKEYEELCNFIFEGSYKDDYVTITDIMSYPEKFEQMKILYNRAEMMLLKTSKPTQEFKIDAEDFIFTKVFEYWSEQLETGCLINVELAEGDIAPLFLSNLTVNYCDHTTSMTFGNRFNKFDSKSLFDGVLGKINKSANTISYIKDILYPIKNGELNDMREEINSSRNLTTSAPITSFNGEVVIDSAGYTGRKKLSGGNYDSRQIKIPGNMIVITEDAWDTRTVAIGEINTHNGKTAYGLNAQVLMGDITIGDNLRILDNNGNELIAVVDLKIESVLNEVNKKFTQINQTQNNIVGRVKALEDLQKA